MHDMAKHDAVAHHAPTSFIAKYVFSLDHKVIGKQYYGLALLAALVGMGLSWLMRLHLGWTNLAIPGLHLLTKNGAPGNVMTPEFYLQLMTMHATIMVFFVLTTAPFAAFLVLVSSFFVGQGPTLGGWTQYAPLSAIGEVGGPGEGTGVVLWAASIGIFCIGQLLGSLNFITTTLDMRTKGMSLWRLPLSTWGWFITSCMGLTAFAVLMPACILLILDHVAGTSFFVPGNIVINDQMQPHSGGSTLLWQHLFWFFGHPEVYIAIVPGMGIVSHILITNMRRPLLSNRVIIGCMAVLAVLSYMVYGHHMFVSGMNPFSSLAFSFPTLVITIPATIIVLIQVFSLYGSKLRINAASLFGLGFISMFIAGGVSGFFLAQPSIDIMLHATYFVVGHFHLVMGVAAMFGIFSGTYFWFPKMYGRMMNETLGKVHIWLSFVGAYCIFMPFHYLGLAGNVRRYQAFTPDYMQPLIPLHRFITVSALITGAAQLIFLYNLIHSRFWGAPATDNPWQATSLEWSTPTTPPPHNNFGDKLPEVFHDPYQYGVESSVGDYVMQTSPEKVKTASDEA